MIKEYFKPLMFSLIDRYGAQYIDSLSVLKTTAKLVNSFLFQEPHVYNYWSVKTEHVKTTSVYTS